MPAFERGGRAQEGEALNGSELEQLRSLPGLAIFWEASAVRLQLVIRPGYQLDVCVNRGRRDSWEKRAVPSQGYSVLVVGEDRGVGRERQIDELLRRQPRRFLEKSS